MRGDERSSYLRMPGNPECKSYKNYDLLRRYLGPHACHRTHTGNKHPAHILLKS